MPGVIKPAVNGDFRAYCAQYRYLKTYFRILLWDEMNALTFGVMRSRVKFTVE